MTAAKRVAPVLELLPTGEPLRVHRRGGMDILYLETALRYLAQEGADEIWLRLAHPDERGAAGLFDTLKAVRPTTFVPLVAWGSIRTAADARLVLGLGADRVVLETDADEFDSVVGHVRQVSASVGGDRVTAQVNVRRVAMRKSFAWELTDREGAATGIDAQAAILELVAAGADEVLIIPLFEGALAQHAADLVERISEKVSVQVVSMGTEKDPHDLAAPLLLGADGVVTAGLFTDGTVTIGQVKTMLRDYGLAVRPAAPPYAARR